MTEVLTIKEASEKIKVKVSTIYKWVSAGTIPHYKLNGSLRFNPDTLEKWMQRREIKSKQ